MDTMQAIRAMMTASGKTHRQIAHDLGKYDTYVSQILSRGKTPQVDTLTDLARTCGYRLELVPTDGGAPITIGRDDAHDAHDAAPSLQDARAMLARASAILDQLDG